MFEFITWSIAFVLAASLATAYRRNRDPLHPLMFLAPLMAYMYVFRPLALMHGGFLDRYFKDPSDLVYVQTINFLGLLLFCLGVLQSRVPRSVWERARSPFTPTPRFRKTLFILAMVIGSIGLLSFLYITMLAGGFQAAFGQAKGGGRSASGYINDAPILTLPAMVLLHLSMQGRKWKPMHWSLLAAFATPYLIMGLLGSRRGPLFAVLMCLLVPWYLVSGKRPTLRSFVAGGLIIALAVMTVYAHRKSLYLGSDVNIDAREVLGTITLEEDRVTPGETFLFASALITASRRHDHHFWGARYAVIFLVRPIPRQLWPTKYEDTGMGWMTDKDRMAGLTPRQWKQALGWFPAAGAASGFVADLYLEFGEFCLAACWFFGWLFGMLWKNALVKKGVWTLLYAIACILSIYIPTQSVSAFMHRFLLMGIPTAGLWQLYAGARKHQRRMQAGELPPAGSKGK